MPESLFDTEVEVGLMDKKAILSMLAVMLFIFSVPMIASDDSAAEGEYNLWVNDHEITGDESSYSETEHWTFDSATNTLYLNGVDFRPERPFEPNGIIYDGRNADLNIVLSGENYLERGLSGVSDGINKNTGVLRFSGESNLDTITILSDGLNCGINLNDGEMIIEGGTVYSKNQAYSNESNIRIGNGTTDDCRLTVNGGKLFIEGGAKVYGDGFLITDGYVCLGDDETAKLHAAGSFSKNGQFKMTGGVVYTVDGSAEGHEIIELDIKDSSKPALDIGDAEQYGLSLIKNNDNEVLKTTKADLTYVGMNVDRWAINGNSKGDDYDTVLIIAIAAVAVLSVLMMGSYVFLKK